MEHDLPAVPPLERGRHLEIVSVTLAEMMADTGHYSIDSTTIRPSACLPSMLRIAGTL